MSKVAPLTIALSVVCVVLYIPQALGVQLGGYEFNYWLCVSSTSLARPWELVTAIFAHWSLTHLAMNVISLLWLGTLIESWYGAGKTAIIFFVSGIAGNLAVVLFGGPQVLAAGASGAIFGLLGATALLYFSMRDDPRIRSMLTSLLIVLGLNVVNSLLPGISLEAHLGGLVGGVACEAVILAVSGNKPSSPSSSGGAGGFGGGLPGGPTGPGGSSFGSSNDAGYGGGSAGSGYGTGARRGVRKILK